MTTQTIGDLKQDIFNAQAKLAEVERRFQLAAIEFQNNESAKTFNAMDNIRLERCGAEHELERAIAILEESVEEITGGTRDAAEREMSDACDAWIDANKKCEAAEDALAPDFCDHPETPEVKAWLEAMRAETLAGEVFEKVQAKFNSFENN